MSRALTHEHLHEVAAAHREEGHAGLAGHSLGQQGLAGARRTYEECPLGNLSTQFGVFLGVLQEVDNLLHLFLRTHLAGHVLERDAQVVALLIHLGLALAHAEHATAGSSAHPAEEDDHQGHEEHHPGQVDDGVEHVAVFLVLVGDVAIELARLLGLVEELLHVVDRTELHLDVGVGTGLLDVGLEDILDELGLHVHAERLLRAVHNHLVGSAFRHPVLEIVIVVGLGYAALCPSGRGTAVAIAGEKQHAERNDDTDVNPVHVELGHVRLVLVILFHLVDLCLDGSKNDDCGSVKVGQVLQVGVRPEGLQTVEVAHLGEHHVHHHVGVVHRHPLGTVESDHAYRLLVRRLAHHVNHRVGYGVDLEWGTALADDEILADGSFHFLQVSNYYAISFFLLYSFCNVSQ